jgi:hypothetical protein
VFADGSRGDDRDLMRKNIQYKEVNFVEKEDNDKRQLNDEEEEEKTPRAGLGSSRRVGGLGFTGAREESGQPVESGEVLEDDFRTRVSLGARILSGGSQSRRGTRLGFQPVQQPSNEDKEQSYFTAFRFNQFPELPLLTTFAQHTITWSDTMHAALIAALKPTLFSSKRDTVGNNRHIWNASYLLIFKTPEGRKFGLPRARQTSASLRLLTK